MVRSNLSERIALAVYSVCFLYGTLAHAIDIARGGWLPYRYAPFGANVFWSLLAILDPSVVILLICRRRFGLALAVIIMVLDAAVNSYAVYALPIDKVSRFLPLQLPTLFCGFVLGSVAFLWRASSRPLREAVAAGHVQEVIRKDGISPGEAQRGLPDGP
jgi:hypothetical protein